MAAPFTVKPSAMVEWLTLLNAIAKVTEQGSSTPCTRDPEPFTSEDYQQRIEAAAACAGCPVLSQCRDYAEANAERWHVWAGTDRTKAARKEKP